ncbi:hypothetical protein DICSQDRAFT_134523 [Dichomitus squalens LYAD-421 SS1]|uniref:DUF6533 domain-containing protein n=1 Tax=Dichomitus squalens TaxID=114155 RepID=A0A4Q9MUW0_9APHY|nr:uncharacterized protein DICSQDRAFT_134523 [Dichomitus squalens LYAD-421 SS1]EJF63931.1 hypothetical protein DICSQDRAFT_134523 [Dichomitus squalens LYAD-421 SS1]TBU31485.1 hypothetical protein BD311DRAFT_752687 [Dichomitus squalens]
MSAAAALALPYDESPVTLVSHAAAVKILTLVGLTSLLYDHFVTLPNEVTLIWRARKGVVSTIFLLNRYIVPAILALDIYETFGNAAASIPFCKVWTIVQSFLTISSYISIHAIVAWRVYAIYNGQRWVSRLLWIGGSLNFAVSAGITTASLIPIISDLHPFYHSCVGNVPNYIWSIWLPSIIFETLLFGLTIKAMFHEGQRRSLTSLSLLLYRDGMLYFVAVTFCSLFSLMVWALAGPDLLGLARYFALAMVNIAGSRLVLNLKEYAATRVGDTDLDWDEPSRTPSREAVLPMPYFTTSHVRSADGESSELNCSLDLELYSIERECQQLGTRLH